MIREDELSIISAIVNIKSDAQVTVLGDDVNRITWSDGNPTNITNEQILAKQAELQAEYDTQQYQRDRIKEYPKVVDCIHALLDGGATLTDLQAKRTAVKDKYPKS